MFVSVPIQKFSGPKQADDMSAYLARMKEATVVRRIENQLQVRLSEQGLLANKFRLTRSAAKEFGSRVAKNFGTSLLDLADNVETHEGLHELAGIINSLTNLRYSQFEGWRWVLDSKNMLAVGLLGPRYRIISNSDFWEGIRRTSGMEADKPKLFTALISGRNLDVVMAGEDRVSVGSQAFVRGVLAQNAETSGRAVRTSNVLISTSDYSWACDNFYPDTRIPHLRGRKFDAKMTQIYDRLRQRRIDAEELRKAWSESSQKLIVNPRLDRDKNIVRVTEMLRAKGLSGQDAKLVATEVLVLHKRPVVTDLFRVLSRRAVGRSDINAIKCRQIAYSTCFLRK